jgi:hypothetical protein
MIELVFTLDYEIYGNGCGSLRELVYEPGEQLRQIFHRHNARFVNFVEVSEFSKIDAFRSDSAIDLVKQQVKTLFREGFEIALHLHPQWANASYVDGRWALDFREYNLCTLPRPRIDQIVSQALEYLRQLVEDPLFTPLSFRAGNWLFQPTGLAASVLAAHGLKLDSSVFKGGVQHDHGLDYRPARRNGYFWPFSSDVNRQDRHGEWIEVPIQADMVPLWRMRSSKRMHLGNAFGGNNKSLRQKLSRMRDFLRFRYPLKLDFCRMTLEELMAMMQRIIRQDAADPATYRPIVAIGHTKDLSDPQTVDDFLGFLASQQIKVATFQMIYPKVLASWGRGISQPAMQMSSAG